MSTPCSMGVGCDEFGICFAAAHGRPEMCPRDRDGSPEGTETGTGSAEGNSPGPKGIALTTPQSSQDPTT